MKYLITGTTEANESEVIKSLESLWDAADEQNQPFVLMFRSGDLKPGTPVQKIKEWVDGIGCIHEVVDEGTVTPPFDIALILVGESPDTYTLSAASALIDRGIEVRDLAGQMTRIEFETEQVPQEPVIEAESETVPDVSAALLEGGWPGETPEVAPAASEPEKYREVPAKAQEVVHNASEVPVDAAVLLKGVTESDIDRMPKAALKGLVDKLDLEADRRSPGSMQRALMEKVIELDKTPPAAEDVATYGAEAEAYVADTTTQEFMDAQDGCPNDPSVSSMDPAPVTMTNADGSQEQVVRVPLREEGPMDTTNKVLFDDRGEITAKFIETHYSDGTVVKVPVAVF